MRMRPAEWNQDLAEATLAELESYLLSSELFWPTERRASTGSPPFPRLTIGNLLLALDELSAQAPKSPPTLRTRTARIRTEWDRAQAHWLVALERKARREAEARSNLWHAYLAEVGERSSRAGNYGNEVRNRVILARLGQEFIPARAVELGEHAQTADRFLRAVFRHGEFIWDEALRPAYPPDGFWFLYGFPDPAAAQGLGGQG
jgi:hypothetical protein